MFKLVVLSAVLAAATAAPGLLGGYALPAATSYSSRIDVHSKPLLTAYAAPVVAKTVVASPVAYAYPAVSHHVADYGLSGYSLGHDYGLGYGHGYGIDHGYGYGHGW